MKLNVQFIIWRDKNNKKIGELMIS